MTELEAWQAFAAEAKRLGPPPPGWSVGAGGPHAALLEKGRALLKRYPRPPVDRATITARQEAMYAIEPILKGAPK